MTYIMLPKDQNPYYDSARDKPDRSEFASLRMDIQEKPRPAASWALLGIALGVIAIAIIAVAAKRLLF